jgi:hypothetical protein
MNYQFEEARLSAEEIVEIHRNMEARGLSQVPSRVIPNRGTRCVSSLHSSSLVQPTYAANRSRASTVSHGTTTFSSLVRATRSICSSRRTSV